MIRSPPPTPTPPKEDIMNVTIRKKTRDHDEFTRMETMIKEMKTMISDLVTKQTYQSEKIDNLQAALEGIRSQNNIISAQNSEIRTQNEEIQKTVTFLSEKYDDVIQDMSNLQAQCDNNQKVIKTLEQKIDFLEKSSKESSIEIKNLPSQNPETKETLINSIQKLGNKINQPVHNSDIKNIFRLKSKTASVGAVIVDFSTTNIKEQFLASTRNYNKQHKDDRLSSTHLLDNCPKHPLYVSEVLTTMAKRLHYLAREFVKSSDYEQCWTANGKVYVRQKQGIPSKLIKSEDDLAYLRKQNK